MVKKAVLALALVLLLALPAGVYADQNISVGINGTVTDNFGVTIDPAQIDLSSYAGTSVTKVLTITNTGSQNASVTLKHAALSGLDQKLDFDPQAPGKNDYCRLSFKKQGDAADSLAVDQATGLYKSATGWLHDYTNAPADWQGIDGVGDTVATLVPSGSSQLEVFFQSHKQMSGSKTLTGTMDFYATLQ